ncbi:MAG: ATP-dependent DNA helicase [Polyangiaceae bacterium]|nr:ATP-dependent DNA helicase [Polyangiaceae bacterium]
MPTVAELLGPSGPLAFSMPGYELRQGQLQMAEAVEQALDQNHVLLCEAGTGTGKTMAYLVPAILSQRKIVVSTATKALQDQIINQDIPAIAQHLRLRPSIAVAKGLANYLCRRRYEIFRSGPAAMSPHHHDSLARIEAWVRTTKSGDVAELTWLPEHDKTWYEVCSGADTRLGNKCPFFKDCFVTHMRRQAEAARIVVANHHLVFADVAVRRNSENQGGVLPSYDSIIFDEAHQIEDVAADFFGLRVSTAKIDALTRDADQAFRRAGMINERIGALGDGALGDEPLGETAATELRKPSRKGKKKSEGKSGSRSKKKPEPKLGSAATDPVRVASRQFFDTIARQVATKTDESKQALDRNVWIGDVRDRYHKLDSALEALQQLAITGSGDEVQTIAFRAASMREHLQRIVDGESGSVTWLEVRSRSAAVGATPIEVAPTLQREIFERVGASILTSATLTISSGFRFFRSRVGVDSDALLTKELSVKSPFDFASNALLYTPTDLPEPGEYEFAGKAAMRTAELVELTEGGALVLCTSNRSMASIHDFLRDRVVGPVMIQGEAPKSALLSRFRESGSAVLVATMSFWEGVDIAGDALRLVVIDKIPFAVPGEPIVMARCNAIDQAGGKSFWDYSVPSAAITLKQGFGRLIRTRRDRGIVAVLDSRIVTRSYGKTMIKSLPPAQRALTLDGVREFWDRVGGNR